LLSGVKFIAWLLTGSNAIFTDALESLVNVAAGSFALYSLYLAAKPKDEDHPYGHGKIEFLSATVEGSLIAAAGIAILIKSIYSYIYPEPIEKLNTGILLSVFTGGVNFAMGFYAVWRGKKTNSATLRAGGKHLLSDAWSTVGLIIGLLLLLITGLQWIDTTIALLFGLYILYTGIKIVRESVAGIMDEADPILIGELVNLLNDNRKYNWIDIHNLRIIKYGASIHIDCHVTLPYYYSVDEAHDETENIHRLIQDKYGDDVEIFVHVDPCLPTSCHICEISDCPVRKHAFEAKVIWMPENVMRNRRHGLPE
jgi:cation diffusion facilitator family transporter